MAPSKIRRVGYRIGCEVDLCDLSRRFCECLGSLGSRGGGKLKGSRLTPVHSACAGIVGKVNIIKKYEVFRAR